MWLDLSAAQEDAGAGDVLLSQGAPIPESVVTATLRGGPHDGETLMLPWARAEIRFPHWESLMTDTTTGDVYRLVGPWRGQDTAEYKFVEPAADAKAA